MFSEKAYSSNSNFTQVLLATFRKSVQHSAVERSAVQHSAVQRSAVQRSAVQRSAEAEESLFVTFGGLASSNSLDKWFILASCSLCVLSSWFILHSGQLKWSGQLV